MPNNFNSFERADKIGEPKTPFEVEFLDEFLPKSVIEILKKRGIKTLFPPQKLAIEKGLFTNRNIVISIPTASGKTLLAELAMVREIINGGKCLYVVPLRALASEKYDEFKKWERIGLKTGITTGDYESKDEWLGDSDIIVTTAEKADSLVRNKTSWVDEISCLVVDEVHLLDSARRGANLEILISRMLHTPEKKKRIIALSATIPNSTELADWLKAEIVNSDWRPVPLYEGIFYNGELELYDKLKLKESKKTGKNYTSIVSDCIRGGGQVLIFDSTRKNAESTALKLSALNIETNIKNENILSRISDKILEENDGEMSLKLAECVEKGVAFHHAGLLGSQRRIIENAFRRSIIKVIVSTPTLAAGVNLPARRVIIKTHYRFSGYSNQPIKVMEYKQMVGRAGRPGMDDRGEAITIVRSKASKQEVFRRYIAGEPEKITSKLGTESCLRFHTLALVSEFKTIEKIEDFYKSTFFFYQNNISVKSEIEKIIRKLEDWGFIDSSLDSVEVTELGDLISKLYIDPLTGYIFYSNLESWDIKNMESLESRDITDIKILHLICMSPDMERLYLRKGDDWIEEYILKYPKNFIYIPSYASADYDWFLREVKTAICLESWINEVDEDTIYDKFNVAPGDLRRITETAEWLANALYKVSVYMDFSQKKALLSMIERIRYGIKEELIELVKLRGIGRVRARKLYNSGIRSKNDLIEKREEAEKIVGKKVVENALKSITSNIK